MNTLREWFTISDPFIRYHIQAVSLAVLGYLLSYVVHFIVVVVRQRVTSKTKTDLDDKLILVVEGSIKKITIAAGLYFAAHRLIRAYEGTWAAYLDGIFFVIVVFFLVNLMSASVRVLMEWYVSNIAANTESTFDDELVPLVKRVVNLLVYAIALAVCLDHFHIDIKALVVSLGVGSFAIAFAAQETLANMIAGFVIMIDRPFRIGDRIKISSTGQVGEVKRIGLRSTQILDFDYNVVTIPNADILKNDIINFGYPEVASRIKIEIGVAYGTDIPKAKQLLVEICESFEPVLKDPKPAAHLVGFGDSSLNLIVVARAVHYKDVFETSDLIRMKILEVFDSEGIEIPFPQRVVHMKSGT